MSQIKRKITQADLLVGRLTQELQQTDQPAKVKQIKRLIKLSREEDAE